VYGNLISKNIDPIEKKPLYHYYPGSTSFSIATPGCNFRCDWCQNWQISQMPRLMSLPRGQRLMPDTIVNLALEAGCQSISYTYTEPTIFFEYSFDTAKLAQAKGLKNVYVTNGFMTFEMLEMLHPYLDAANVDIKAFRDESYRKWMGGRLEPVLDSCRKMKSLGIWLEITTLIVPDMNDDPEELKALANFINQELGSETPWHLSRFYPQYQRMDTSPTEESILYKTKEMAVSLGL
jgi:pyruvate formate lyase activating enzyme